MGSFSIWHWLVVLVIVLLVFGAGKLPSVMRDMAKGVKAFKKGLNDEDGGEAAAAPAASPAPAPAQPIAHGATAAPQAAAPQASAHQAADTPQKPQA